ncbi:hypothetical protein GG344DRAFT_68578 [Lentinula edodes]|nr:hypothetical protein GG344DRAFT_68578 [Lentinula edodes]
MAYEAKRIESKKKKKQGQMKAKKVETEEKHILHIKYTRRYGAQAHRKAHELGIWGIQRGWKMINIMVIDYDWAWTQRGEVSPGCAVLEGNMEGRRGIEPWCYRDGTRLADAGAFTTMVAVFYLGTGIELFSLHFFFFTAFSGEKERTITFAHATKERKQKRNQNQGGCTSTPTPTTSASAAASASASTTTCSYFHSCCCHVEREKKKRKKERHTRVDMVAVTEVDMVALTEVNTERRYRGGGRRWRMN